MAHDLRTYAADRTLLSFRSYEGRGEAFDAYDRACRADDARVVFVELTGDGVNRVHRIDRAEEPDDLRQAPAADGEDRERGDDAPALGDQVGPGDPPPPVVTDTVVNERPSKRKK